MAFVAAMVLSGMSVVGGQETVRGETAERIDEFMSDLADRGYAGSLIVEVHGEVILARGYGKADRAAAVPVTPDTVFDIGSVTKQFTAAAILRLEEQGVLRVEETIDTYFSDVPADKRGITIHQLLTHTAGFRGGLGSDDEPVLRDEYIERALQSRLAEEPGTAYRYSNVGYSLLAAIIEIVTAGTYEEYLREHLFAPAGMNATGYILPDWSEATVARGYGRILFLNRDRGTPLDRPFADDGPYWNLRGNGGILSTVRDMYRWHRALEEDAVLSAASREALCTPFVDEGGGNSFYSYGWAIFETRRGTTLQAHNGGNGIFFADMHRYIEDEVFIFITSSAGRRNATEVSGLVADMLFR